MVRTMGYAKTPLNPPSEYLKKGANSKPPVNAIKPQPFKYPVNENVYISTLLSRSTSELRKI